MSYPYDVLWGIWINENIESIPQFDIQPYTHVVARSVTEAIEKFMDEENLLDGEYIAMVKQLDIGVVL